jgi:hypothetical protein
MCNAMLMSYEDFAPEWLIFCTTIQCCLALLFIVLSYDLSNNIISYILKSIQKVSRLLFCHRFNIHIVTCWVYNTRQVTSRRIGYSEFIAHSLLHLYNSQFTITAIGSITITSPVVLSIQLNNNGLQWNR